MGKKFLCFAMAAVLVAGASFVLPLTSAGAAPGDPSAAETQRAAVFLQSVTMTKKDAENAYAFTYTFNKNVSEQAGDIARKDLFTVGGKALSEVSGATVRYTAAKNAIEATVPVSAGLVEDDGSTRATLLGGLITETDLVTTVRYIYDFYGQGAGNRIYRSDDPSDYEEVTVTSIAAPTTSSGNTAIYIYFSDSITPKKYHDLQMSRTVLNSFYGPNAGNTTADMRYTAEELELLFNYQVFDPAWERSLSHTILFGCEDYNGLKAYPANRAGIDMTPKDVVGGIDLYDVRQYQNHVAEEGVPYLDKSGARKELQGSTYWLSVQVHIDENWIEFIMKGDAHGDSDLGTVLDAAGNPVSDMHSFNENLRPDFRQTMALSIREGFFTPNGKLVKETVTYLFDKDKKSWSLAAETSSQKREDETLGNQEGYTDEELALLAKQK